MNMNIYMNRWQRTRESESKSQRKSNKIHQAQTTSLHFIIQSCLWFISTGLLLHFVFSILCIYLYVEHKALFRLANNFFFRLCLEPLLDRRALYLVLLLLPSAAAAATTFFLRFRNILLCSVIPHFPPAFFAVCRVLLFIFIFSFCEWSNLFLLSFIFVVLSLSPSLSWSIFIFVLSPCASHNRTHTLKHWIWHSTSCVLYSFSCASCVHSIIPVMNVVRFNHRKCSLFFPAFYTKVFKYLRARDNSSIKIQVRPLQSAAFSFCYVLIMSSTTPEYIYLYVYMYVYILRSAIRMDVKCENGMEKWVEWNRTAKKRRTPSFPQTTFSKTVVSHRGSPFLDLVQISIELNFSS